MNKTMKDHLKKSLQQGIRGDGRELTTYRNIEIERNVSKTAEGSCRVKFGETEVIVGVSLSLDRPFGDRPEEGIVMVGAELLAMASPEFETGPPGIWAIEIARVTDRGIRESHAIDLKALCVTPGEKVWAVSVDVCTINDAGGLLDAAALGAMAALQETRLPEVEDGVVNYKKKTDQKLPINLTPISVTVVKVGNSLIVDPTSEEEKALDARLTITTLEDGRLCSLQKGGDKAFTPEEIDEAVKIAAERSKELRGQLSQ